MSGKKYMLKESQKLIDNFIQISFINKVKILQHCARIFIAKALSSTQINNRYFVLCYRLIYRFLLVELDTDSCNPENSCQGQIKQP